MKVADCMTRDVKIANPTDTLVDAAKLMAENDFGSIPVQENDRLIGMVTDRDIVVRGLARGLDCDAQLSEVMTRDIKYCFEDQEVEDVLQNMGDIQVRRLPVVNRDKRLVGIISIGDLADDDTHMAGEALDQISRRGGEHSQALQ